jgi:hypothetical protein
LYPKCPGGSSPWQDVTGGTSDTILCNFVEIEPDAFHREDFEAVSLVDIHREFFLFCRGFRESRVAGKIFVQEKGASDLLKW